MVSLFSDSRNVNIETEFDSEVKDHRMRVCFPLNEKVDFSFADGHFDLLKRKTTVASQRNVCESPPKTHPQQNFTYIEGKDRKLTVVNEGLSEYEATPQGNFYLTLLRGVGWLSRCDLLIRKGHAGPSIETPGAQVLGKRRFKYSLFVEDKKSSSIYSSYREAYLSNFPVIVTYTGKHKGSLAGEFSFFKIIPPDSVIFSCLKKKEDGESVILRFFNPLDDKIKFKIEFYIPPKAVYLTNLKEGIIKEILVQEKTFKLEALGKKIITLLIKF